MEHLNIDIETFSSVDIGKAGLYKYVQSPDFELLLFAYAADFGEPIVVDLTAGEKIPAPILRALFAPSVRKHAYNAPFEWYSLSRFFGLSDKEALNWLPQWRCTMLHGLYCGYTAGLGATGKALGLPEDKQKMMAGKALIRRFCCPCKPTNSNGGRTRTLPAHEPEKWNLFKEYNAQDVTTEMEIYKKLESFPVPQQVQLEWEQDQIINARGIAVDTALIDGAMRCDETIKQRLTEEAVGLSGLDNPNSVPQLSKWINDRNDITLNNLTKETVETLLEDENCKLDEPSKRLLQIRQELSKTSVKKYTAMVNAMCQDGRVRGLLQFYGANRTGRWSGRLVQVQNLPRTYVEPLDFARDLVKKKRLDALQLTFGSVPDTLSQLIRTAFVAREGCTFIDADFSAIEARVISWLAGEQWRLDVFHTHGKIYEASASQMFGVPIEKITKGNPEYALRQKGKVAELALGYQGGVNALIAMGALKMGLAEEELLEIVQCWRASNKRIKDLWYAVQSAAVEAITTCRPVGLRGLMFRREADLANGQEFLTVKLPSGRKLFYAKPAVGTNEWGSPSVQYWGMDQITKKWHVVDTYGGKLTENIVQAIARDCLSLAISRLEAAGYPVIFHVHDEVVIEYPEDKADLDAVCKIMGQPVPWAPGLPLNADGYTNPYFKKE